MEEQEYLVGRAESMVDEAGRITLGKKNIGRLGKNFTIALTVSGCLAAFPKREWSKLCQTILDHDIDNPGRETCTRMIMGDAESGLNLDAQGRVVIPPWLRELGRLKERTPIFTIGCGDRLEIWAKEEYERYSLDSKGYGLARREKYQAARKMMKGEAPV